MDDIVKRVWKRYLGNNSADAELAKDASLTVEQLRVVVSEMIRLCALGDVDENTETYGWGELITKAKKLLPPGFGTQATKE